MECTGCLSRIAEKLDEQTAPDSDVRTAYQHAIEAYRELSRRGSFDITHQYHFCLTLLSAAEFEDSISVNQRESLVGEAKESRRKLSDGPQFLPDRLLKSIDERIKDLEK